MIDGSICLDRMHGILQKWYLFGSGIAKVWLSMIFIFEVSHSFGQKMCLPSGISNFGADFVLFGLLYRKLFMKLDVFWYPFSPLNPPKEIRPY